MKTDAEIQDELVLIKNTLEKAFSELMEMEERAGEEFYEKGIDGLENVLVKRAQIIVDLPRDMSIYLEHVPNVAKKLKKFSDKAKEILINNDFRGLCFLLDPKKAGGKNELEKIIEQFKSA